MSRLSLVLVGLVLVGLVLVGQPLATHAQTPEPTSTATRIPEPTSTATSTATSTPTAIPAVSLQLTTIMTATQLLADRQTAAWQPGADTSNLLLAFGGLVLGFWLMMALREMVRARWHD